MKGDELRARRNFHVAKRITSRLERQYGITLDHPTARETVTPIIDSLRASRNEAKRDVSTSPPVERLTTSIPRATLENRRSYLSGLKCIGNEAADDDCIPRIPESYEPWLTDDYLFLQLGPISTGTQNKHKVSKHPECDEPECGSHGWRCDLCQEVDLVYEPMVLEEAEPSLLPTERTTKPSINDPVLAQNSTRSEGGISIHQFIEACPVVSAIRRIRLEKRQRDDFFYDPSLFEEPASFYHQALPEEHQDVEPTIPVYFEEFDECLLTLALVLLREADPPSSQTPGFDMAIQPISVCRGQDFVFDRGKICPCVPWLTRAHTLVVT